MDALCRDHGEEQSENMRVVRNLVVDRISLEDTGPSPMGTGVLLGADDEGDAE